MRDEMNVKRYVSWAARCLGIAVVLSVAAYASYVGVTWYRYGHVRHTVGAESADPLLDSFMPAYDVAGRQHLRVAAPAQTTFSAGRDMNLQQSVIVRAIFRTRELILGSEPEKKKARPLGLVDQAKAWGWGMLAEDPGHEFVFGAVTQPWAAKPVFRALSPDEFAKFQEPGYVKIAWMLRIDAVDGGKSMASTETRVVTTDPVSRANFRRYWSWASPGMFLIRWVSLRAARDEAERRVRGAASNGEEHTVTRILRIVAAIVLIVHGLIHLMGTAVYAGHAEIKGLSYKTTLLSGHWDLGRAGISVYGWLWVLPAVGFVVAAVALLAGWAWWNPVLVAVTLVSLVLTVLDWSNAFRGVVVDVAILALIFFSSRIAPWFSA
jgi:hypothetical protein